MGKENGAVQAVERTHTLAQIENPLIRRDLFSESVAHAVVALNAMLRLIDRDADGSELDAAVLASWNNATEFLRFGAPYIARLREDRAAANAATTWREKRATHSAVGRA